MLSRKTLAPAAIRAVSISGESVAGPKVQTILVLRMKQKRRGRHGMARASCMEGRQIELARVAPGRFPARS